MSWFEVKLLVPDGLRDSVINRLFEMGAEGVDETSRAGEISGYFPDSLRASVPAELSAYVDSLAAIFPDPPRVQWTLSSVVEKNWAELCREHYPAQKLSHLFFLKPAWDQTTLVPDGMLAIVMEPGQAFGTGLHPTTRLCLILLERLLESFPSRENLALLDVGTGTGILAMAAKKLGVGRVHAIDIDPVAVETAIENCKLNDTASVECSERSISDFADGEFDIVVSNILLETHRLLAVDYQRVLKRGGTLVLSGLLVPQQSEMDRIVDEAGFVGEIHDCMQEWLAMTCVRRDG